MTDVVPCRTCRWCQFQRDTPFCQHALATTEEMNYYAGVTRRIYLTANQAREINGPCGPDAILWDKIP